MISARQWAINVARAVCSPEVSGDPGLPLARFQSEAASRLAAMIRDWGGALLADSVGLGKTRVALAVATTIAREQRIAGAQGDVWLCVPSRLQSNWRAAAKAAGLEGFSVATHTAFSRGTLPARDPLMIVVDEAHRFRNVHTARRAALTTHATVPMLLVTATPVANSIDDLWSLLALFLDDDDVRRSFGWDLPTARWLARDGTWDPLELVREVAVRRTEPPSTAGFGRRPDVSLQVLSYEPCDDEAWLWSNLEREVRSLSLFDADDDWPTGLFVEHVLRRWESGPHALLETVDELHRWAERRLEAAREGRSLDRQSFRVLFAEQPQQEVFSFLYPDAATSVRVDTLPGDVERLAALRYRAEAVCSSTAGRDTALVELAGANGGLLIFTSYRSAARGLFDRLVDALGPTARVGLVTGDHAEATGLGRAPADEVLRRFAPRAHGVELRDHERLDVLVATDCIAEGVNLQDCGRIVLADLPYTPLGVEQRIGRLLRPGGEHDVVQVYLCRPRRWNDSLGMRRRLQTKLQAARDVGFGDVETGPLAALTVLERIAALHAERVELASAARLVAEPTTWIVLARVSERPWMFVVGGEAPFVEYLSELAWDDRQLEPCEVPAEVESALRKRQQFLDAAHHAPTSLQLDDPESVAWRLLTSASSELGLDRVELSALRSRLLRRHRLGTRRQLARLAATGNTTRLLRFVRSLPGPAGRPTVELVAALGIE